MASLGSGGGGAAEGSLAAELQAAAFHLGRHRKAPPSEIFFCSTRRRQTFWKLESVASRRQRDQEAEHHQRFVLMQKKPFSTKFFDQVDTKLKTAATRLISVSLEKPKNRFEEVKSLEG